LSVQARVSWLPIDAWYRGFIEHEEGGHAGTDRDREIGRGDLFQIEFDHHILGDLPAFGGTILQPLEPILHLGDAALEPRRQGFVGQCRAGSPFMSILKVSIRQLKAARSLIGWSQEELAAAASISLPTIKRLEAVEGPLGGRKTTVEKIRVALERAGIEFIDENGGGAGVRLRKRQRQKK